MDEKTLSCPVLAFRSPCLRFCLGPLAAAGRLGLGVVFALLATACVEVDGGAVEMSWLFRTPQGRAVSGCECTDPAVRWVRFELEGVAPAAVAGQRPCQGAAGGDKDRQRCTFSCTRHNGATPLDIPPGTYAISIVPLDGAGADLTQSAGGAFAVPSPVLREVKWGQALDLGAVQITAPCASRCLTNITANCTD